jgi:hypothetical protein
MFAQANFASGTLANLAAGGSIGIDDKIFSGFSFQADPNLVFNASQITVTASIGPGGVDYLTFGGNIQLAGLSSGSVGSFLASADLLLGYSVTATGGQAISMIDQKYTGGIAGVGSLTIDETATSGANTAKSHLDYYDVSDPNTYPNGTPFDIGEHDLLLVVPPQTTLDVTKDISFVIFNGDPGTISQVSISSVQQSYHQVPEPGAMLLGSLGGGLLLVLRLRRQARRD